MNPKESNLKVPWNDVSLTARLSHYAYFKFEDNEEGMNKLKDHLKEEGLELTNYISDENNTECFIARDDKRTFIVFRGTEQNAFDIITDLKFRLKDDEYHRGFYKAYQNIRDKIYENLREGESVIVTGHSLGGALATIALLDLDKSYDVKGFTFGAPAVGTEVMDQGEKVNLYRFVNNGDIVPRALAIGPILMPITRLILKAIKGFTAKIISKTKLFYRASDYLDILSVDLTKYQHPVPAFIFHDTSPQYEYNQGKGFSLVLLVVTLFFDFHDVYNDHKITNYIQKTIKIST